MNKHDAPTFGDILIVDDTPENLRVLSNLLTEQGYEVRKVINGYLALKAAQNAPPAIILLDILMPGMDGYKVCSLLKAHPITTDIPVIFISALDDVFDKIKAFEVGGSDYITKPFHAPEVIARIKNQLTIRNQYLQLQSQNDTLEKQNQLLQEQIKERQRAEAETRLLLTMVQTINSVDDFYAALEATLHLVCETMGWDYGEAWIPSEDGTVLKHTQRGYALEPSLKKFQAFRETFTFAPEVGLPGLVWSTQQPQWIEEISLQSHPTFVHLDVAYKLGLKTVLGIPVLLESKVFAILVFFKKETVKSCQRLIALVNAVATQLGSVMQRKKAEVAIKKANLELQRLATLDDLTGVANRRLFNQSLNQEWLRLAQEQLPLSLILCDIDYFKRYNDTYGHLTGDFCLQQVAQAIRQARQQPRDLIARYGGEEFVLILPNTRANEAIHIAEVVRNRVMALKIVHAQSSAHQYVTLSIGVASLIPQQQLEPSILIALADKALYEAKKQGRNRSIVKDFERFSPDLLLRRLNGD